MTPAIQLAKQQKLAYQIHEYQHDSSTQSYGLEAVEKLNLQAHEVFKTLVVINEKNELAVAVLPVDTMLNLKKMASAIHAKKVKMADPKLVEKTTGYVLGGVSPINQKKKLMTVIDSSVMDIDNVYVSAGRRGLEISLMPQDLIAITNATVESIVN